MSEQKKRRPSVPAEEFVVAYVRSKSCVECAKLLGGNVDPMTILARANKMRAKGIRLPKLPLTGNQRHSTKPLDVDALNRLIEQQNGE